MAFKILRRGAVYIAAAVIFGLALLISGLAARGTEQWVFAIAALMALRTLCGGWPIRSGPGRSGRS